MEKHTRSTLSKQQSQRLLWSGDLAAGGIHGALHPLVLILFYVACDSNHVLRFSQLTMQFLRNAEAGGCPIHLLSVYCIPGSVLRTLL